MPYTPEEIAARLSPGQRLALLYLKGYDWVEVPFARGNATMRSLTEKWLQENVKAALVQGRAASKEVDGPETSYWSVTPLGYKVREFLVKITADAPDAEAGK